MTSAEHAANDLSRARHRRGTAADAETRCALLIADSGSAGRLPPPSRLRLGDLLPVWLAADHPWKSATLVGYRSNVRALLADPLADQRVAGLTPQQVRTAIAGWQRAGASLSVVGSR